MWQWRSRSPSARTAPTLTRSTWSKAPLRRTLACSPCRTSQRPSTRCPRTTASRSCGAGVIPAVTAVTPATLPRPRGGPFTQSDPQRRSARTCTGCCTRACPRTRRT
ncbi:hypothetical protein JKP88DRAFT_347630 [Tribonema minus]|uniref:Uncharacterized protein n=1 Tax=Tribonema minus TaxID=303371 RepID=A0A835ZAP7_9STRA|nr:hypothetical protein JKP88DRAFT_347630 [Tribonema minus]